MEGQRQPHQAYDVAISNEVEPPMKVIRDDEPAAVSAPALLDATPSPAAQVPEDNFPYDAPWWLRYPTGLLVLGGAWYCAFEWQSTKWGDWIVAGMLAFIAVGLMRELLFGLILAAVAGLLLWGIGGALAALPASVAIIVGAMIIASKMR
jgi:hypothetical protein